MDTPLWFFQVWNQKEYQKMVLISFVHLEKINNFCFMRKGVAQKIKPTMPSWLSNFKKPDRYNGRKQSVKIVAQFSV